MADLNVIITGRLDCNACGHYWFSYERPGCDHPPEMTGAMWLLHMHVPEDEDPGVVAILEEFNGPAPFGKYRLEVPIGAGRHYKVAVNGALERIH